MAYVDGFVIPVPDGQKDAFVAFNKKWAGWFKEMGAIASWDCWADEVPEGEVTDFHRAVALKEGETVVFSWMIWPDKPTREAAWAKLTEIEQEDEIPFDGKRMIYGGFTPLVVHD